MGGNNFSLVGTCATAPRILGEVAAVTSDEASPLAETRDVHASGDPDHLAYHELNRERGRPPGALRICVRFKRHTSLWFDYLMVSLEEMSGVVDPTPGASLRLSSRTNSRRAASITLFFEKAEIERYGGCLDIYGL